MQAGAGHITFDLTARADVDAAGFDGAAGAAFDVQYAVRNNITSQRKTFADHGWLVSVQNCDPGVAAFVVQGLIVDCNHGGGAFSCWSFRRLSFCFFEHS